jgi:hypothetical protein
MKKLLVLASCFAVILILSNVSFAQETEAASVDAATPCPCTERTPSAFPFTPPPHNSSGSHFAGQAPQASPFDPSVRVRTHYRVTYTYGQDRAARRAARFAPPPFLPYATGGTAASDSDAGLTFAPGAVAQTGHKNALIQRSNSSSPVINFLSVVRGTPRYFDAAAYPSQVYPPAQVYPIPAQQ